MTKKHGYMALSALGPLFALALAIAFTLNHFKIALVFALLIVLCMEGRVQLMGRVQRTGLFWFHLACAVPFVLILIVIAFWHESPALEFIDALFFLGMIATATMLWHRGLRNMASAPIDR